MVGFAPKRPPPPRALPPPIEGEEPKRPPGVAGLSALEAAVSAGLGWVPKENPPAAGAGAGEGEASCFVRSLSS